mgnify:CR=1 FL=1
MVLNGFNQEGGKVTGNIGKVEVISRQNTSTTTGSSSGISLGISANGVPSSVNINGSRTNGDRAFVDNQSTFIVGEGSSLHVGTLENTGAVVGKQGNSTFKIDSYVGKDIQNHDTMKTTGGSVGISTGKPRITNVGFNQDSRDKQGITRNTVIGDVEIGETSGSQINRDLGKANEVTRDTHSSTNINVESQTIEYATNPAKLKEDIGKAKEEINDIKWAIDKSIHDMGHDNRNFFGQLSEVRLNKTIDNITSQRLIGKTADTEIAGIFKDAYKDLGYDIEIIFSDPKNSPQLLDENDNPKTGTAYVRDENGKKIKTIIINGEDPNNATKAGLIGTIVEEGSHVIGKVEGRQRKTGTDEKGLESTGRASNEYFTEKYKDDNTPISIHSDGKDYSNVDFGENVGDRKNEGWNIYKKNLLKVDSKKYTKEEIQNQINWWYFTQNDLKNPKYKKYTNINWNEYQKGGNYTKEINYYYFLAKHSLRDAKYESKINDTQILVKYRNGKNTGYIEMTKIPEDEAIFHNMEYNEKNKTFYFFMDARYTKYVADGGEEMLFDKNNKAVYDPVAGPSYNTRTYPLGATILNADKRGHKVDVDLWREFGIGPKDPSNSNVKLRKEMGELLTNFFMQDFQSNYYRIKDKAHREKKEKYSYEEIKEIMKKGDY